jgi:DtxR family transcriptional regulator, manganese transport regulator
MIRFHLEKPSESAQDYLACILELIEKKGYARLTDVAATLAVTESSACAMIKELARQGYVKREKYRGFTLTETGQTVARQVQSRRLVLTNCLRSLGLPDDVILHDVDGLEHHLSKETLDCLKRLVKADSDQRTCQTGEPTTKPPGLQG